MIDSPRSAAASSTAPPLFDAAMDRGENATPAEQQPCEPPAQLAAAQLTRALQNHELTDSAELLAALARVDDRNPEDTPTLATESCPGADGDVEPANGYREKSDAASLQALTLPSGATQERDTRDNLCGEILIDSNERLAGSSATLFKRTLLRAVTQQPDETRANISRINDDRKRRGDHVENSVANIRSGDQRQRQVCSVEGVASLGYKRARVSTTRGQPSDHSASSIICAMGLDERQHTAGTVDELESGEGQQLVPALVKLDSTKDPVRKGGMDKVPWMGRNKKLNRTSYTSAPDCADEFEPPAVVQQSRAAIECCQLRYQVTEIDLGNIFNYKQREILHGINLTVPEGVIYGLLGPSGCGKTTMLKCVAGRLKPLSGTVRVFGFKPGEPGCQIPGPAIGYMPQELSVYDEFTISETLAYFGMINLMPSQLIKQRIDFLIRFLDLPSKRRLVRTLSGGQKRRVSLAAALVHSPPLLILDEPTVGVDPLLREIIWNYLVQLAKVDKITIVITTHYIEEARQADIVGLMRHGNLLAEDSPANLMLNFNAHSLERVFLRLCMRDKLAELEKINHLKADRKDKEHYDADIGDRRKLNKKSIFTFNSSAVSPNPNEVPNSHNQLPMTVPLATIELSLGSTTSQMSIIEPPQKDAAALGATPTCCTSVKSADQVTLMIDDETERDKQHENLLDEEFARELDQKKYSNMMEQQKLTNIGTKLVPKRREPFVWLELFWAVTWKNFLRLRRNPPVILFQFILPAFQVLLFCLCIGGDPFDVPLAIVNEESVPQASRLFLNSIDEQTFRKIYFDNLSDAIQSVRLGQTLGAVHIPERYTQYLQDRLFHPADASNITIQNGTISIYPDLTNLHLALSMENAFRQAFVKFARDSLELFGYDPELAGMPVKIEQPIYGGFGTKPSYLEFMAPGVVVSITYVMATGLTALAFILEKRDGMLERSQISGVTSGQILMAHVTIQVVVMLFQVCFVLFITFGMFDIPAHGHLYLVFLLILLQGCTGMGFGLIISAICDEENTAVMMLVGTFYINLILAGIIWPIEAMPKWLRVFSYAQPQTLPVDSLRNILSRGWDFDEKGVYLGFIVTIGWLLVFLIGAGTCMRYFK